MPRFKDMLGGWTEGFPEDAFDQLHGAYDDDLAEALAEVNGTASAKIEGLTTALDERDKEINALKAANWDLSQLVPKDETTAEEDGEPDNEPDNEPKGLDAFFTDDEEDK